MRVDLVATAYVYDQKKQRFLLTFHRKLGKWLPPGGHLNLGEGPHTGALRELNEEIGVEGTIIELLSTPRVGTDDVPQLPLPLCVLQETIPPHSPDAEPHLHIDFIYVVEIAYPELIRLRVEEVSHAAWFTVDEIRRLNTFETVMRVCAAIVRQASKVKKYM